MALGSQLQMLGTETAYHNLKTHCLDMKCHPKATLDLLCSQAAQKHISSIINVRLHHHIVAHTMHLVGNVLMGLLLADDMPAYNLYGLFRFHSDLMALQSFASTSEIPNMEVQTLPKIPLLSEMLHQSRGKHMFAKQAYQKLIRNSQGVPSKRCKSFEQLT